MDGHRLIHTNGSLVLRAVKAEDSGYYTCTATNTGGFDTIIVNLLVQGAPLGQPAAGAGLGGCRVGDPDQPGQGPARSGQRRRGWGESQAPVLRRPGVLHAPLRRWLSPRSSPGPAPPHRLQNLHFVHHCDLDSR